MKVPIKEAAETAIEATKWAQITTLVKENQLVTALCLFILWQTGTLLTISQEVGGVMC